MMIGSVLKEARGKLNLSQPDVAQLVGVTKQTYLKWENDVTEPKASQIALLAKVLEISEIEICQGKLHQRMPLNKFIIELSKIDASYNMQTLRAWEQLPDHYEYLKSLIDNESSDADNEGLNFLG